MASDNAPESPILSAIQTTVANTNRNALLRPRQSPAYSRQNHHVASCIHQISSPCLRQTTTLLCPEANQTDVSYCRSLPGLLSFQCWVTAPVPLFATRSKLPPLLHPITFFSTCKRCAGTSVSCRVAFQAHTDFPQKNQPQPSQRASTRPWTGQIHQTATWTLASRFAMDPLLRTWTWTSKHQRRMEPQTASGNPAGAFRRNTKKKQVQKMRMSLWYVGTTLSRPPFRTDSVPE